MASGIVFTLLLIGMLTLAFSTHSAKAEPTTIIVPDDYERIQWAVGNATEGDTIFVRVGTYYEHVTIRKSISLIGESKHNTTIDGGGTGNVVYVNADNITISGFTIQNGDGWLEAGILLESSVGNTINDNIMTNNEDGVCLIDYSMNNTICNNEMTSNRGSGIFIDGYLGRSTNNTIKNNKISNNELNGIAIGQSNSNVILDNTITLNDGEGILLYDQSDYTLIRNNTISLNNGAGIVLRDGSNNSTVISNTIVSNDHDGIHLAPADNSTIAHNNISYNAHGISGEGRHNTIYGNIMSNNFYEGINLYRCESNIITDNTISDNDYGIKLELSSNNTFYHNNITNNTNQVSITPGYANVWDDGYPSGGNYWSDYAGEDVDGDGIGDTPYVIDEDNQDNYPLGVFAEKAEPFPTLIVAVIVIIAVVGAIVIVYFMKFKK